MSYYKTLYTFIRFLIVNYTKLCNIRKTRRNPEYVQKIKHLKKNKKKKHAAGGYNFDLTVPHMGIYARSPFYIGANIYGTSYQLIFGMRITRED